MPQISYWATSAELSETEDFPLFMRTIPTDERAANAVRRQLESIHSSADPGSKP